MNLEQILVATLAAINIFAFIVTANDKRKSIRRGGADRTPEGLIFFLAAIFGGFGVYAAMQIFRHKTRKWYFQIGIPLLILQNLAILYLVRELLVTN